MAAATKPPPDQPESTRKRPGSGHGGWEPGDWLPASTNSRVVESPRARAPDERTHAMEASSSRKTASSRSRGRKRSASKKGLESFNPATGELVGTVETLTPSKVQGVVDDVAEVQPFWAQLSLEDRARYMRRAGDVLLAEVDELAELLTREQGKPRVESYSMELLPTVDALKWIADNGPEILADEKIPFPQAFLKTKRAKFSYEPIGVVGVIAPWNYPWSIPFGE